MATTTTDVRVGSGFRLVGVGMADSDGYLVGGFAPAESGDTDGSGIQRVFGAKTINPTIPEPQTQTQTGDDGVLASEQYSADTLPTGVLELGYHNAAFVAFIEGILVNTVGGVDISTQGTNSADKPTAVILLSRRAKKQSGGRAWENKIIPAAAVTDLGEDYTERAFTSYRYAFTASPVQRTPWGELLSTADYGTTLAPILTMNADNPIWMDAFLGDAVQDDFILSFVPKSADKLHVYVEGVEQVDATDYNVNLTTGVITFTVGHLPPDGDRVDAWYEYDAGDIE